MRHGDDRATTPAGRFSASLWSTLSIVTRVLVPSSYTSNALHPDQHALAALRGGHADDDLVLLRRGFESASPRCWRADTGRRTCRAPPRRSRSAPEGHRRQADARDRGGYVVLLQRSGLDEPRDADRDHGRDERGEDALADPTGTRRCRRGCSVARTPVSRTPRRTSRHHYHVHDGRLDAVKYEPRQSWTRQRPRGSSPGPLSRCTRRHRPSLRAGAGSHHIPVRQLIRTTPKNT